MAKRDDHTKRILRYYSGFMAAMGTIAAIVAGIGAFSSSYKDIVDDYPAFLDNFSGLDSIFTTLKWYVVFLLCMIYLWNWQSRRYFARLRKVFHSPSESKLGDIGFYRKCVHVMTLDFASINARRMIKRKSSSSYFYSGIAEVLIKSRDSAFVIDCLLYLKSKAARALAMHSRLSLETILLVLHALKSRYGKVLNYILPKDIRLRIENSTLDIMILMVELMIRQVQLRHYVLGMYSDAKIEEGALLKSIVMTGNSAQLTTMDVDRYLKNVSNEIGDAYLMIRKLAKWMGEWLHERLLSDEAEHILVRLLLPQIIEAPSRMECKSTEAEHRDPLSKPIDDLVVPHYRPGEEALCVSHLEAVVSSPSAFISLCSWRDSKDVMTCLGEVWSCCTKMIEIREDAGISNGPFIKITERLCVITSDLATRFPTPDEPLASKLREEMEKLNLVISKSELMFLSAHVQAAQAAWALDLATS